MMWFESVLVLDRWKVGGDSGKDDFFQCFGNGGE